MGSYRKKINKDEVMCFWELQHLLNIAKWFML